MKVERKEAKKELVGKHGAQVGDQILFSSHNPQNNNNTFSSYITRDKLYTVVSVEDGTVIFVSDNSGMSALGSHYTGWQFDVIVKAPQPEPKFNPVVLTLETQGEVDMITTLLGEMQGSYSRLVSGDDDLSYRMYESLHGLGFKSKGIFNVTLKETND